jgi:hypothetical protein
MKKKNILNTKKSKNNKKKKFFKIIKEIEIIRAKNNKHWMDLYRLAFEYAPDKASKVVKQIRQKDSRVTNLAKKLK